MPTNIGSSLFSATGVQAGGTPYGMSGTGNGQGTSVARIKISVSIMFLAAVVALVLLHRAGFRFSVTVG